MLKDFPPHRYGPEDYSEHDQRLGGLANNIIWMRLLCSPVRMYMFGTHWAQAPIPHGCTKDRFWTAAHFEYAKYTFSVKAKTDCEIYAEIPKYETSAAYNGYRMNPHTTFIVRDQHTGEYGIIEKPRFHSSHNNFAWEYQDNPKIKRRLHPEGTLSRDDIIAQSPSISPDGRIRPGVLVKTTSTSSPYVAEDGYLVSKEITEAFTTTGYGRITINVPDDHYLLLIAGTDDNPQPIPGPGELIRADRLLAVMRRHDDILDIAGMSPRKIRDMDFFFDKKVYVESYARDARVVDIEVYRNDSNVKAMQPYIPDETGRPTDAISRHSEALRLYYRKILLAYQKIMADARKEGRTALFTPEFTHLINYATGVAGCWPSRTLGILDPIATIPTVGRNEELSGVTIIVTYTYTVRAGIGSKITGMSGNKGVICMMKPRSDMPTDRFGNVADLVMSSIAPLNRMSASIWTEHYLHYKADECEREIRRVMEETRGSDEGYDWCFRRAMMYYSAAVPMFYDKIRLRDRSRQWIRDHVDAIVAEGLDMEADSRNPNIGVHAVRDMETLFPSNYENAVRYAGFEGTEAEWNATEQGRLRVGPVRKVADDGTVVYSDKPEMIGGSYFMMLEHVAKSYSASMEPSAQVHGVPAKTSKSDRNSHPYHVSSGRMYGEADVRSEAGQTDPRQVADQIDRVNNPAMLESIYRKLVDDPNPGQIESLVDRDQFPQGQGLHLAFLRNHMYCAGAELAYWDTEGLGVPPKRVIVEESEDLDEEDLEEDEDDDDDVDTDDDFNGGEDE